MAAPTTRSVGAFLRSFHFRSSQLCAESIITEAEIMSHESLGGSFRKVRVRVRCRCDDDDETAKRVGLFVYLAEPDLTIGQLKPLLSEYMRLKFGNTAVGIDGFEVVELHEFDEASANESYRLEDEFALIDLAFQGSVKVRAVLRQTGSGATKRRRTQASHPVVSQPSGLALVLRLLHPFSAHQF